MSCTVWGVLTTSHALSSKSGASAPWVSPKWKRHSALKFHTSRPLFSKGKKPATEVCAAAFKPQTTQRIQIIFLISFAYQLSVLNEDTGRPSCIRSPTTQSLKA